MVAQTRVTLGSPQSQRPDARRHPDESHGLTAVTKASRREVSSASHAMHSSFGGGVATWSGGGSK